MPPIVDRRAISLLALGGPLGRRPPRRTQRDQFVKRRVGFVTQGRRDQHVVALPFARHDLTRVSQAAEVGKNLPDALRSQPQCQHADDTAFVDDRTRHEGHRLPGPAKRLERAEFCLKRRAGSVEAAG